MINSEAALLPCPFCGETPDADNPATFRHEIGDRWASVVCCIVGPEIRAGIYTPLEEWRDEAIAAWNERAETTALATATQRIRELEAELADEIIEIIGMREMYGYEDNDEAKARYQELTGREYGKVSNDDE